MALQEQVELNHGGSSHEAPVFDQESLVGATHVLIDQLEGLRQFSNPTNLDTSMEILSNLLTRVPPSEEITGQLTDFVNRVPDTSNNSEKRHYVRMLRFLAPFVNSERVLNGLDRAKSYREFNEYDRALPILVQLKDKQAALSRIQILLNDTDQWSRHFSNIKTAFESLEYIPNEGAVAMLQNGLRITNEKMTTIEKKSSRGSDEDNDMHSYRNIRSSIISALAYNEHPSALHVLTQELEFVANRIVNNENKEKTVYNSHHTFNLQELVSALMTKSAPLDQETFEACMSAFLMGNTDVTNIIGYGLLPSGPLDHSDISYERGHWEYDERRLFMAELAVLHGHGSEEDNRLIQNKMRFSTVVELNGHNFREHDLDIIARDIAPSNKSFIPVPVFVTPECTQLNFRHLMGEKAIRPFPTIVKPIWIKNFAFAQEMILHNPRSSAQERASAAMAIKDIYMQKGKDRDWSYGPLALLRELFVDPNPTIRMAVTSASVSLSPQWIKTFLTEYPSDTAVKRGILFALEQSE